MDATKARNFHFKRQEGSSAIRHTQRGYGGLGMVGGQPMQIRPSMKDQYETLKRRAVEINGLLDVELPAVERERIRSELADIIREAGNLREILQNGSRLAFEKIFVNVANRRLPKNHFLLIIDEAREIWRSEGYNDLVPPPTNEMRRRTSRNALRLGRG